jgi:GTP-binding protein
VVLEAAVNLRTLRPFRRRRLFPAPSGRPGQSRDRHGKNGSPLIIQVPLGTRVFSADTGRLLGDLLTPGARLVLAKGGRGGKGNAHFTSAKMRSPRFAQPGEKGGERRVRLELAILADVGLMGGPNAGKSTLLTSLTAAKARVASFPFTTLSPQLGVLSAPHEEPLVLAEIPGLLPGAHRGRGLGHRFLRHLRRTRLLVVVIDSSTILPQDPLAPLRDLDAEMRAFDPALLDKPRLIALNKEDLLPPDFPRGAVIQAYAQAGRVFPVSALTGRGLENLRAAIWEAFRQIGHEGLAAAVPE